MSSSRCSPELAAVNSVAQLSAGLRCSSASDDVLVVISESATDATLSAIVGTERVVAPEMIDSSRLAPSSVIWDEDAGAEEAGSGCSRRSESAGVDSVVVVVFVSVGLPTPLVPVLPVLACRAWLVLSTGYAANSCGSRVGSSAYSVNEIVEMSDVKCALMLRGSANL